MKDKQVHVGQALVTGLAVVMAVSQTMPEIQALIPPKYAVGLLALTNVLSALLPKLIAVVGIQERK